MEKACQLACGTMGDW